LIIISGRCPACAVLDLPANTLHKSVGPSNNYADIVHLHYSGLSPVGYAFPNVQTLGILHVDSEIYRPPKCGTRCRCVRPFGHRMHRVSGECAASRRRPFLRTIDQH
jgi:hypothetical protein